MKKLQILKKIITTVVAIFQMINLNMPVIHFLLIMNSRALIAKGQIHENLQAIELGEIQKARQTQIIVLISKRVVKKRQNLSKALQKSYSLALIRRINRYRMMTGMKMVGTPKISKAATKKNTTGRVISTQTAALKLIDIEK